MSRRASNPAPSNKSRTNGTFHHLEHLKCCTILGEGAFVCLFPPPRSPIRTSPRKMNNTMLRPQVVILKEGTDTSQGRPALLSNITACLAVVDMLRSTLGPRGMDKLIVDGQGKATVSNDGATLLRLLDVVHPAARALVDLARAQDAEVGDGTTSVVLLAGEILRQVRPLIEDGVGPQVLIRGIRAACRDAVSRVKSVAVRIHRPSSSDDTGASLEASVVEEERALLECAKTAMQSKLIAGNADLFARIAVDAVRRTMRRSRGINPS